MRAVALALLAALGLAACQPEAAPVEARAWQRAGETCAYLPMSTGAAILPCQE